MRLYPPDSWLADEERPGNAGVPEPERRPLTKPEIALELLDRVRGEGLPVQRVVADAGYGVSREFRDGLAARGLEYVVGVPGEAVVFADEPAWDWPDQSGRGRPWTHPRLASGQKPPVAIGQLAGRVKRNLVTWREGTKGKMAAPFAWVRVWPGHGWSDGECDGADLIWLLIEEQADGKLKFAFSNLPAGTSRLRAVRLWKSRRPVEQGYQQLKEELGPDHFEGRSWRGFHHHAAMILPAYGFLLLEQQCPVDESNTRRSRKGRAARPLKSGKGRSFPTHEELRNVLVAMSRHADGYVFHGSAGGRLKPDRVRRTLIWNVLTPLAERFPTTEGETGFAHGWLHSFRHFFCSFCATNQVSQQVVMRWLGHRDSKMVAHYFTLHDEDAKRQMPRLDLGG